jgi:hypothetical protein
VRPQGKAEGLHVKRNNFWGARRNFKDAQQCHNAKGSRLLHGRCFVACVRKVLALKSLSIYGLEKFAAKP